MKIQRSILVVIWVMILPTLSYAGATAKKEPSDCIGFLQAYSFTWVFDPDIHANHIAGKRYQVIHRRPGVADVVAISPLPIVRNIFAEHPEFVLSRTALAPGKSDRAVAPVTNLISTDLGVL